MGQNPITGPVRKQVLFLFVSLHVVCGLRVETKIIVKNEHLLSHSLKHQIIKSILMQQNNP